MFLKIHGNLTVNTRVAINFWNENYGKIYGSV